MTSFIVMAPLKETGQLAKNHLTPMEGPSDQGSWQSQHCQAHGRAAQVTGAFQLSSVKMKIEPSKPTLRILLPLCSTLPSERSLLGNEDC